MDAAPEEVGARWMAAMRAGDWEAAWQQTDRLELPRRRAQRTDPQFRPAPHHLHWDGTPFAGRRVLVRCEHGLGDTLQFLRFVPLIERQARELHVMVQPPLVRLLQGAPGLGQVHNGWCGPDWPAHDVEIEVMELAYAFRATAQTLPPPYPHLAERARQLACVAVPDDGLLRVGLLWGASEWDTSRSVPVEALGPLLSVEGARFHALQQGPAAQDPRLDHWGVVPLWRRTQDVEAAAAAMLQLDLIVCVDAMPAHLAGSLGRPTWLLLKHEADWRWGDLRDDTPWYPSLRLFRQPRPDDWAGAVRQAAAALQELCTRPTASAGADLPPAAGFRGTVAP